MIRNEYGRRIRRAGLIFLCWAAIANSAARAACPDGGGAPLPGDLSELHKLNSELADLAEPCARDAPFLAYRGAVLLALARPTEAASLLELSLLLSPDAPVTQIDYARALTQLGDLSSAAAIWRALLARPDLPPHLRAEIESRLASVVRIPAESTAWRQRREVSVRAGYDTNLNSASSLRELTLLFPDFGVTLPIAASAQPVDGGAAWFDARWQAARAFAGGRELELRAEIRLRGAVNAPGVSYRQADVEATGHQRIAGGLWTATLSGGDVLYGGSHLFQTMRSSVLRSWAGDDCALRVGGELEGRQYPTSRTLDGRYTGAVAGFACRIRSGRVVGLVVRAGIDDPVQSRPGGQQLRTDARIQGTGGWMGGTLQGSLAWQGERDREGYSPLLAGGIPRSIQRITLGVEWTRPILNGWLGVIGTEAVEQKANLPLFELRGVSVQTGVKRVW